MSKILIQVAILLFSINLIFCANENNQEIKEDSKKVVVPSPEDSHKEQSIFPVDKETEHLNLTSKYPIPKWMKETNGFQTGFFIFSILGIVAIFWIAFKAFR